MQEILLARLGVDRTGLKWGAPPRRSGHEARDARQHKAQDVLDRTSCRQMNLDHGLHLNDARGDLDQAQPQRVELRAAPE